MSEVAYSNLNKIVAFWSLRDITCLQWYLHWCLRFWGKTEPVGKFIVHW